MRGRAALVVLSAVALGCPAKTEPPPMDTLKRCEVDLARADLFTQAGSGAKAFKITQDAQRLTGQFAQVVVGDYVLENDRIRAGVTGPMRLMSHVPFGGTLVDADLKRADGEPGRDQMGQLGLIYNFGRAVEVKKVEVLQDGSAGGPAIIAATGVDQLNDFIDVQANVDRLNLGLKLALQPDVAVPLRMTTYFAVSPGEARVRQVTAFCNDGDKDVVSTWGDITAGGGTMDFFNPGECKGGFGEHDCLVDPSPWFGWQGDGVAYGYRSYQADAPTVPEVGAILYLSHSAARLSGMKDLGDVLTWADPMAKDRPGRVVIPKGGAKLFVRDWAVGASLADVGAQWLSLDKAEQATVTASVVSNGQPIPQARVLLSDTSNRAVALAFSDAQGKASLTVAPGTYRASAAVAGRQVAVAVELTADAGTTQPVALEVGAARQLTVKVKDPFGAPIPAKVQVRCEGPCPVKWSSYERFGEQEPQADDLAFLGYVPPQGSASFTVPPGSYRLFVTRGPEWSAWPDTFPMLGAAVDLSMQDATVEATLAHVVDTTGWMSADLHVHAVNSADAQPTNESRVLAFAAEGVDVLVSTDHEWVTDYTPVIQKLGAQSVLASVIGCEVSPTWGHHNLFPLVPDGTAGGGAVDWPGGADAPALRPPQLDAAMRTRGGPNALIQMNHPRGNNGMLTNMKVDTLTGASHGDPVINRMAPDPKATADDTRLFGSDFDALEVENGFSPSTEILNDWFVFLSRGLVRTGTAVSDTHNAFTSPSGYGRTFVKLGVDTVDRFDGAAMTAALKAHRAVGSNGPFLTVTAQKLDGADTPTGPVAQVGDTVSIASGDKVRLFVDVQAPEWMKFDRLELFTHAEGREAWNGDGNGKFPTAAQSKSLDPMALPVEAVPGLNGFSARKVHVTHTFDVQPAADAWFVVMVRSTGAVPDMQGLMFRGGCNATSCNQGSGRAAAFANPIFVDADGSGAYDTFALKQGLTVRAPPRPAALPPRALHVPPTLDEARSVLQKLKHQPE